MYQKFFAGTITSIVLIGVACAPHMAAAQSFIPLIPGLAPTPGDMSSYLERVYILAISIAALIAVGKIILAGIKYTTSGVVTEKGAAKKDIQSALIGLLIILAAVVMLRTINPSLANLPALTPAGDLVDWSVVKVEVVADKDALDIHNSGDECAKRASEGYVFHVYTSGTWDDYITGSECCILGSTGSTACKEDTLHKITDDIIIDSNSIYTIDAYDQLLADIRNNGFSVFPDDIIVGETPDASIARCEADSGNAYQIKRDRGIAYTAPIDFVLCVTPQD